MLTVPACQETLLAIASTSCTHHDDKLPVWTHKWVCVSDNHRRDEPALWVWVNEILLDSSNEALVLDCCIMPVDRLDDAASAQLMLQLDLSSLKSKVKWMEGCEVLSALTRRKLFVCVSLAKPKFDTLANLDR